MTAYPYMKVYRSDWRGESRLRRVSLAAEGLWFRLCMEMDESPMPGVLLDPAGLPLAAEDIAAVIGRPVGLVTELLAELRERRIFSEVGDPETPADLIDLPEGTIFSRRMVRKEEHSDVRSEAGKRGAESRWKMANDGKSDGKPMAKHMAKKNAPIGNGSGSGSLNSDLDPEGVQGEVKQTNPPHTTWVAEVVAAWNRGRDGSRVASADQPSKETKQRDAKLLAQRKNYPEPERWEACARALAADPWFGQQWGRTSLPWILKPGKASTLEEWMLNGRKFAAGTWEPPQQALAMVPRRLSNEERIAQDVARKIHAQRGGQHLARDGPEFAEDETTIEGEYRVRDPVEHYIGRDDDGPQMRMLLGGEQEEVFA